MTHPFIIDREAREIMYLVASVRPSIRLSVRPSVTTLMAKPFISLECSSVSNNRADAVDRSAFNLTWFPRKANQHF